MADINDISLEKIGIKLKLSRKKCKLTIQEAAKYIGCGRNTLHAYESGKRDIGLIHFLRLAELYKIDIRDFGIDKM